MIITFANRKLEKLANDSRKCKTDLGPKRGELFQRRLLDLADALTLEDTRNLPGHFHELIGNKKGQWACNLDHPYRLIFEPHNEPIPTNEHGNYIWIEIVAVEIIEITDYH